MDLRDTPPTARRAYGGRSAADRRAERRERLMNAGLELFGTDGYAAASIEKLCAHAGVSTRNFYEEFESKDQVLLVLHDLINSLALRRVSAALDDLGDADVATRISTLLDAFVETVTADPRMARLNYVEAVGVNADLEQQHLRWVVHWAEFIESEARRAAQAGVAPDRDYRLTAIALVGAVTGLLREWQAHDPPLHVDDIAAEIRGLMLAGITRPA